MEGSWVKRLASGGSLLAAKLFILEYGIGFTPVVHRVFHGVQFLWFFLYLFMRLRECKQEFSQSIPWREFLKNSFDLWGGIALLVPLALVHAIEPLGIVQIFSLWVVLVRIARADWWTSSHWQAGRLILLIFLSLIALGGLLFQLPGFAKESMSWTDSFFLSASALCVTGLSPIDVGTHLTHSGHWLLMLLFQIGGLGPVTILAALTFMGSNKRSIHQSHLLSESFSQGSFRNTRHLIWTILIITFSAEIVGSLAIYFAHPEGGLFWSFFHGISAFCNAGFGLEPDSFVSLSQNFPLMGVLSVLIIAGGLGFPIWLDGGKYLWSAIRNPRNMGSRSRMATRHLHPQTPVVIRMTLYLLVLGTFSFWIFESGHLLAGMEQGQKWMHSFFQSVTLRTAGFNSLDFSALQGTTYMLVILLMIVGAGALSTGGGIKVITLYLAGKITFTYLRGQNDVVIGYRSLPNRIIQMVLSIVLLYVLMLFGVMVVLSMTDPHLGLEKILFESVSALSTVGLSSGALEIMSPAGKMVLIFAMVAGRIGILGLVAGLWKRSSRKQNYRYPEVNIPLG